MQSLCNSSLSDISVIRIERFEALIGDKSSRSNLRMIQPSYFEEMNFQIESFNRINYMI